MCAEDSLFLHMIHCFCTCFLVLAKYSLFVCVFVYAYELLFLNDWLFVQMIHCLDRLFMVCVKVLLFLQMSPFFLQMINCFCRWIIVSEHVSCANISLFLQINPSLCRCFLVCSLLQNRRSTGRTILKIKWKAVHSWNLSVERKFKRKNLIWDLHKFTFLVCLY